MEERENDYEQHLSDWIERWYYFQLWLPFRRNKLRQSDVYPIKFLIFFAY